MNADPFFNQFLYQLSLASLVLDDPRPRSKFIDLGLGLVSGQNPKTITSALEWLEQLQADWSADYRLFSQAQWDHQHLFAPLLDQACSAQFYSVESGFRRRRDLRWMRLGVLGNNQFLLRTA